jgi:hypothetical protein
VASVVARRGNDPDQTTKDDVRRREFSASAPHVADEAADGVETALSRALAQAAAAGRFDVVAQLAKELEARRLARAGNVVAFTGRRPKHNPSRR